MPEVLQSKYSIWCFQAPSPQSAVDLVDRSVLIDKIIRLQKDLAKKDEKCDFLEEHIALLTAELRRRHK